MYETKENELSTNLSYMLREVTSRQTDGQTDKQRVKHNLLGGGNR